MRPLACGQKQLPDFIAPSRTPGPSPRAPCTHGRGRGELAEAWAAAERISALEETFREQEETIQALNNQLALIQNSHSWRVLTACRRLLKWVLPQVHVAARWSCNSPAACGRVGDG